ncbi:MAG: chromate transporter [Hallerella porci]|uniref:Chromate transporter n=1 Tax=Hallerella porci TaxID=1945871 RepID=A0ABX5LIA1_9BACT|nr:MULTISPECIES: chromate transporter [Hallerella]MCI5599992.1 chromate transporter [Hallerella sp.]MDY3920867.1 chromate transporter [Hallerella porci]PWK91879.1 chromate transporter [Hallerella porci]
MTFLSLFITFFQIGLFGFGGGYGMLSLIQHEVVTNHHWMTAGEFTDIVAISQMTPGPVGINTATYAGYTALQNEGASSFLCFLGSCTATFALVLPTTILMLLISRYLMKYKDNASVRLVLDSLRPAVVGLLAAATLLLMTKENFGSPQENAPEFFLSVGLFLLTFIGAKFFKIGPIKMIVVCAGLGLLFMRN